MLPLSPCRLFRVSEERTTAVSEGSNCFSICHGKYFAIFAIPTKILNPCYPHRGFQSVFVIHKDFESVLAIQRGFQSVFASHKYLESVLAIQRGFQSVFAKRDPQRFSVFAIHKDVESLSANVFSLSHG